MADPVLVGTAVTALTSLAASVTSLVHKRPKTAASSTGEREIAALRAELASFRSSVGTVDALRNEVANLRGENAAFRTEVAVLRSEGAALRLELANLSGNERVLKGMVDANVEDIRGILGREHTEADARGKLRARVEYIIGSIEGRSDDR